MYLNFFFGNNMGTMELIEGRKYCSYIKKVNLMPLSHIRRSSNERLVAATVVAYTQMSY